MSLAITTATRAEVDCLIDWAAREGWNPGLSDAPAFLAQDEGAFLIGKLGDEIVAGISVARYGAEFGFLGFYIVAPEHRGEGLGLALWNAGMARLQGRVVGLDGVVAQQDNYRKSGFVWAHANLRHQGRVAADAENDSAIRAPRAGDHDALAAFDAAHFGFDRRAFLDAWIDPASGRVARLLVEDGRIAGFGVIRPCRAGWKIGPLFAEREDIAERLFRALAAEAKGDIVILDTPAPNVAAVALAVRHGLAPVFETARMYRGPAPELPLSRIYGITTFELG